MKVLLDNCTPEPLKRWLSNHNVSVCRNLGWMGLSNGQLIAAAEERAFDAIITCDTNLRYQQNLRNRKIAIVQLTTNRWPSVQAAVAIVVIAVNTAMPGSYEVVTIPLVPRARRRG